MPNPKPTESAGNPSLAQIANTFTRHGNFTLGGGSATICVLHRELVDKRKWLSQEHFDLSFALSRVTPGTNLLAFSTGVGWLLRRFPGALVSLLASSIPCTAIVVVTTALFTHWHNNPWVKAAIHGALAAAVAITVKTCWTFTHPHWKQGTRLRVALTATAAFLIYLGLGLPPIVILLGAALVGAVLPRVQA